MKYKLNAAAVGVLLALSLISAAQAKTSSSSSSSGKSSSSSSKSSSGKSSSSSSKSSSGKSSSSGSKSSSGKSSSSSAKSNASASKSSPSVSKTAAKGVSGYPSNNPRALAQSKPSSWANRPAVYKTPSTAKPLVKNATAKSPGSTNANLSQPSVPWSPVPQTLMVSNIPKSLSPKYTPPLYQSKTPIPDFTGQTVPKSFRGKYTSGGFSYLRGNTKIGAITVGGDPENTKRALIATAVIIAVPIAASYVTAAGVVALARAAFIAGRTMGPKSVGGAFGGAAALGSLGYIATNRSDGTPLGLATNAAASGTFGAITFGLNNAAGVASTMIPNNAVAGVNAANRFTAGVGFGFVNDYYTRSGTSWYNSPFRGSQHSIFGGSTSNTSSGGTGSGSFNDDYYQKKH